MRHVNRLGVTSVQNMDGDLTRLQQYARLAESGDLSIRAYHYMSVREETPREYLQDVLEYTRTYNDSWNRTCGIKLFIDGVVEARTAWMLEPYEGTDEVGVPDMDPDVYWEVVVAADALDMDVATHAIGDRGIRTALDAYEAAQQANGGRRERRHRVEHIEVGNPEDLPRFGRLGVTASMQPLHAAPTGDPTQTPWTQLVGPRREPYAFAWRRVLETGARLSFGSDWPIVTIDTRPGIHTAITRSNVAGQPEGGWQPQLSVTLAQALDAYTSGAAYAERQEHVKGTLRRGMLADITAFAEDPFRLSPDQILDVDVALTVIDGRAVHRSL
jgi:predicted amidohydrolase YtcJ